MDEVKVKQLGKFAMAHLKDFYGMDAKHLTTLELTNVINLLMAVQMGKVAEKFNPEE